MEKQNKTYYGNYFWVMEALKFTNKEINFDKNIDISKLINSDIIFYDCLVINDDKEDSVFFHVTSELNEYFSHDKCELILKLLKLYEKKFHFKEYNNKMTLQQDKNSSLMRTELPEIKKNFSNCIESTSYIQETDIKSTLTSAKMRSSLKSLNSLMFGNLYIVYKNNKTKWIFDYELKKLLFYLKFMPDYANIKILRIFPQHIKSLKTRFYTYIDKEDQFSDNKDNIGKLIKNMKTEDEQKFEYFVNRLKKVFYDKYSLVLRKLDIETFVLNDITYLLDVKEIFFEKFDNKHVKLKSERMLQNYQEKFKYSKLKLSKDIPNIKETKNLFNCMNSVYEDMKNFYNLNKYLKLPPKNMDSDEAFHTLRPNCPFTLTQLLDEKKDKKIFYHYIQPEENEFKNYKN